MHAIHIGDLQFRQFFFRQPLEAPDINTVHLAHGSIIANAEGANAALFTKIMEIFSGIKQILR